MNDNLKVQELAEFLHKNFCGTNHTDGCSWLYENDVLKRGDDPWNPLSAPTPGNGMTRNPYENAHTFWYDRAEKLYAGFWAILNL